MNNDNSFDLVKGKTLVIIPAFNEAEIILTVVERIKKINLDYLVVDDCSYDSTTFLLKENNVNYISNKKNLGLSNSVREGMKYALKHGYEYCIQFDGDGQHDENTIQEMIKKASQGYEIVLTSRFLNSNLKKSALKSLAWSIFKLFFKIKGKVKITDPTCGLRMFNKDFMEIYVNFKKFEVEPSTILFCCKKLNFSVTEIPTIVKERETGESSFKNPVHVVKYMCRQIRRLLITTNFWKVKRISLDDIN